MNLGCLAKIEAGHIPWNAEISVEANLGKSSFRVDFFMELKAISAKPQEQASAFHEKKQRRAAQPRLVFAYNQICRA